MEIQKTIVFLAFTNVNFWNGLASEKHRNGSELFIIYNVL